MMQIPSDVFQSLVQERDELENRCDRLSEILETSLTQHEETTEHAETWRRLYMETLDKLHKSEDMFQAKCRDIEELQSKNAVQTVVVDESSPLVEKLQARVKELETELTSVANQIKDTFSVSEKESLLQKIRDLEEKVSAASASAPIAASNDQVIEDEFALVGDVLAGDAEAQKAVKANESLRAAFFIINEETNAVRAAVFGSKRKAKADPDRFEAPSVAAIEELTDALIALGDGDQPSGDAAVRREETLSRLQSLNEEIIDSFRKAVATQNAMAMKAFSDKKEVVKPTATQIATLADRRPVSASASKRPLSRGPAAMGGATPNHRAGPAAFPSAAPSAGPASASAVAAAAAGRGRMGFAAPPAPVIATSTPPATKLSAPLIDESAFEGFSFNAPPSNHATQPQTHAAPSVGAPLDFSANDIQFL